MGWGVGDREGPSQCPAPSLAHPEGPPGPRRTPLAWRTDSDHCRHWRGSWDPALGTSWLRPLNTAVHRARDGTGSPHLPFHASPALQPRVTLSSAIRAPGLRHYLGHHLARQGARAGRDPGGQRVTPTPPRSGQPADRARFLRAPPGPGPGGCSTPQTPASAGPRCLGSPETPPGSPPPHQRRCFRPRLALPREWGPGPSGRGDGQTLGPGEEGEHLGVLVSPGRERGSGRSRGAWSPTGQPSCSYHGKWAGGGQAALSAGKSLDGGTRSLSPSHASRRCGRGRSPSGSRAHGPPPSWLGAQHGWAWVENCPAKELLGPAVTPPSVPCLGWEPTFPPRLETCPSPEPPNLPPEPRDRS